MKNSDLSISIPTYNRPKILKENIEKMIPDLLKYNIKLYISDDSRNSETEEIIEELKQLYSNIYYEHNHIQLGHDLNCLNALTKPTEDYIWYLGDSMYITSIGFKTVLDCINTISPDFIVVNSSNRVKKIHTDLYIDSTKFMKDLAWHATFTGVSIYKKSSIINFDHNKIYYNNFMQLGVILQQIGLDEKNVFWIDNNLVYSNKNKGKSYWSEKVFDVFAGDWTKFILSLGDFYSLKVKKTTIKSHSKNTGLFNIKNLIKYRKYKVLDLKVFIKYRIALKYSVPINNFVIFLISITPLKIIDLILKLKVKRGKNELQ